MPLMSLKEYAAHRGVSGAAVTIAVKAGRCPIELDSNGKKVIDSEKADASWVIGGRQGQRPQGTESEAYKESVDKDNKTNLPPIIQSRSIKEAYQSRMAKLDYEERIGKTIDAEKVKEDSYKVARTIRDNILNIPDRLAAQLSGETSQYVIHKKLSDELKKAIADIIETIKGFEPESHQE